MVEMKSKTGQPEVNLLVLDRLVHDYMVEEDLVDDEGTTLRPDGSALVRSHRSVLSHWSKRVPYVEAQHALKLTFA